MKLLWIQIHNDFIKFFIKLLKIDLRGQLASFLKTLYVVPNKQSSGYQISVHIGSDDSQHIYQRKMLAKIILSII